MTRSRHLLMLGALSAGLMLATILPAQAAPSASGQQHSERAVCGTPAALHARCHAHVVTDAGGVKPLATTTYSNNGFAPSDLQSAYALTSVPTPSTRPTIAIVDAYANPNIVNDLNAYRSQFGLGTLSDSSVPSFKVVNQNGVASPLPAPDTGWGQEIALDVDMASAICSHCNILLVEANSNSFNDLGAAVRAAAGTPGVVAISNSYGGSEFSTESSYEAPYNQPGKQVTVSSGDNGYGVEFPASSQYVTAVGGTSLSKATNLRGWSETAWSGAGSGCSAYIPKPPWQSTIPTACGKRTVADVSAVANPNTGVAVYDSYGSSGGANWMVFGGTSVAAPIIASVYALAGNGATAGVGYPYSNKGSLFDVTSGSNGRCTAKRNSSTSYLCTAGTGYDGPTGLGTPDGVGAF